MRMPDASTPDDTAGMKAETVGKKRQAVAPPHSHSKKKLSRPPMSRLCDGWVWLAL
jgi:hypothetical protein